MATQFLNSIGRGTFDDKGSRIKRQMYIEGKGSVNKLEANKSAQKGIVGLSTEMHP